MRKISKSTLCLLLTIALAALPTLRAQTILTFPTSGTPAVNLAFRLDGTLLETGTTTSTLANADLQGSSRFLWYPAQQALRAGAGLSTETVSQIGQYSVAFGHSAIASGQSATAIGCQTTAPSLAELTLGRYNTGAITSGGNTTWIATDPLLEIGNGTSPAATSDALIVYKNGNATLQGILTVAPGGDIPMFTGY